MKIGYARVSTVGQSLEEQIETLEAKGCERIFTEKITGKNKDRRELNNMLKQITHGDIVLVTRLDRLARNTKDLLEILQQINDRGAEFQSVKEKWVDTTSPVGKLVITVLGGIAEFERERILERTNEGRERAKKQGVKFGRPKKLTQAQIEMIKDQADKGIIHSKIASDFGISHRTVQRILKT